MAITQHTILPLEPGDFHIAYHRTPYGDCVSISRGELSRGIPIVRFHSSCLFGESLHSLDCDCAMQLTSTLRLIKKSGRGVVIYHYAEGRGVGLEAKIKALELQRTRKIDTVDAFALMGVVPDLRNYDASIVALADLHVANKIKFASQNPNKLAAIKAAGYTVTAIVHPDITVTQHNLPELVAKKNKLGYDIKAI